MIFLVMTDIEGVTGVTTFAQAEGTQFGKDMLMNDLKAVLEGIREVGGEAIVYDMHTDGRNVDVTQIDAPVVMGKPIRKNCWRGVGQEGIDGLFMIGLHAMQHSGNALLEHSYLREYDSIHLNGILVGEIGMEAALAGVYGIPLKMVSGDDIGCREARGLIPSVVTCAVKESLDVDCAKCLSPATTRKMLCTAARKAAEADVKPFVVKGPYEIRIKFSDCDYRKKMLELHPEIFEDEFTVVMRGDDLLATWSQYLIYEKEMVTACR